MPWRARSATARLRDRELPVSRRPRAGGIARSRLPAGLMHAPAR